MRVSGLKINNMDWVLRNGLMELHMKATMHKAKSKAKASLPGQMEALTMVIFMITTSMAQESMNGLMVEYSTVIGETIKWRAMEHLPGQMEESM